MAGDFHRVVHRQLRHPRRAAARGLHGGEDALPPGGGCAEAVPADDPCPRHHGRRLRLDFPARNRGEALGRPWHPLRHRRVAAGLAADLFHLLRGAADAARDGSEAGDPRRHPARHPRRARRIHVPAAVDGVVRQLHFSGRAAWRSWLERNHATQSGVWLVFYKPGKGLTYDEAVEEALCFGWIASLIKRLDAERYLRKFTPRTSTGHWSAINLERIRRLKRAGRMTPAGLAKLEKDVQAYVPLAKRRIPIPPDLRRALSRDARARENFEEL